MKQVEQAVGIGPSARAGLALALMCAPVLLTLLVVPALPGGRATIGAAITGLACMWVFAALAVALTRIPPLLPIGMRRPIPRELFLGFGGGMTLMLAVPALSVFGSMLVPGPGDPTPTAALPWGIVLAGIVTAAVTEEAVFRGVGITALEHAGVRTWLAAGISLGLFVLSHGGGWPLSHVLFVVFPLGLALTALYTWRRNLCIVMLAHLLVDIPLVVWGF